MTPIAALRRAAAAARRRASERPADAPLPLGIYFSHVALARLLEIGAALHRDLATTHRDEIGIAFHALAARQSIQTRDELTEVIETIRQRDAVLRAADRDVLGPLLRTMHAIPRDPQGAAREPEALPPCRFCAEPGAPVASDRIAA